MTIGIGITLPDGVLLVADGRQTYPGSPSKEPKNDANKIIKIKEQVFAIYFGHNIAGGAIADNLAINTLKEEGNIKISPDKWEELSNTAIEINWASLNKVRSLMNPEKLRVGLIVGGISEGDPFITGGLKTPQDDKPQTLLLKKEFQPTSLGGEAQNSEQLFQKALKKAFSNSRWSSSEGPKNDRIRSMLNKIVKVIKTVASNNSSIGGEIRYTVIRNGFQNDVGKISEV